MRHGQFLAALKEQSTHSSRPPPCSIVNELDGQGDLFYFLVPTSVFPPCSLTGITAMLRALPLTLTSDQTHELCPNQMTNEPFLL